MPNSKGVLSDLSGSLIIKPCKPSEITFYESTKAHPEFSRFIPKFMGTLSLADKDPAQAAAALIESLETNGSVNIPNGISHPIVVDNAWTPSNGGKIMTDCAIAMGNVAHDYKKPNILDVKLGARLWADDAPAAKRAKLDKVAGETTSKILGFRVAGMRTWQGPHGAGQIGVNEDLYKFYDKDYGRALTTETVIEGFEEYFGVEKGKKPVGNMKKVIRRFIQDLKDLQAVLETEESRMYSASLLFVYEGDPDALQAAFVTEAEILDGLSASKDDRNNLTDGNSHSPVTTKSLNGGIASSASSVTLDGGDTATDGGERAIDGDDADTEDDEEPLKLPNIQALKLIDFAHASWTPGQGPDENMLHGIRKVIISLNGLFP